LLAINPWLGAATLLTWLIVAAFFRYSSLASLVSAVFAPFYQALIWGLEPVLLAIIGMSLLLVWRHQANIASCWPARRASSARRLRRPHWAGAIP
jgi:glycerol-3-phosphate acyltransferase PlsY